MNHADTIQHLNLKASWESGTRTATLTVTTVQVWKDRIYLNFNYDGSRFDSPRKLWWDGEELHVEGLGDLSHKKREACELAISDLEDQIWEALGI